MNSLEFENEKLHHLSSGVKDLTQTMYDLALVIYNLDDTTPRDTIPEYLDTLVEQIRRLPALAKDADCPISQDVLEYVEHGRNPDVYTRQFSELVQKDNQYVHGKLKTIEGFQKAYAEEIISAFPELTSVVLKIMKQGKKKPADK
ncbi:mediator complex subunit Med10 [Schizosaccharomyces japonicus yFS275]|uniref:Mediator of RNA polymerase II transcription subunit 10 n=1 Tax=Schizosaccharomyces japonicus (strain yFS275 / FY16936) TaxID=402676 RepID=B6JWY4_SCHJY|nr:mediator complex subunit Med10 [Schizosaccharomyces japonicus yFS275]EEB05885.1 mediator complex subunit Med10 [Schizosaccharomyces japonicus yFS275]